MGRTLGGDSPLCRRGIRRQGEGEWAEEAPAYPDVKQEAKLPLPVVTWAFSPVGLDLHSHTSWPAGEQPSPYQTLQPVSHLLSLENTE